MNNLNIRKIEIDKNLILVDKSDLLIYPKKGYYIAHQCNTFGVYAGLAGKVTKKFPDTEIKDKTVAMAGTCSFHTVSRVINMYAQQYPGAPSSKNDSASLRLKMFQSCLDEITQFFAHSKSPGFSFGIAFPWKVGCGLGGGDWRKYFNLIWEFSNTLDEKVVLIIKQ